MQFLLLVAGLYGLICLLIYFQQERMIFLPERLPADYRFDFPQPFEEIAWQVDGATLSALHFKVAEPKGVVLFFHGNAGSLRGWGQLAENWTRLGYDLVIPDYRGYGKSTGAIDSEQILHNDALAAYDYVAARFPADRIVVAGRSLGSGLAVKLAAERPARLVILETPYFNLREIARGQVPWAPPILLKYPLRTDLWIGKVNCPVYLIHGTDDELIPYNSSQRLLPLITAPAQLFTIESGHHNDLTEFPAYHQALETILR